MVFITSTANPHIKEIRKLRDRKERQQSGLFFMEGLRIVGEALDHHAMIEQMLVAPDLLTSDFGQTTVERARKMGISILQVSEEVFRSLAQKDGPQGLAAVARQKWTQLGDMDARKGTTWVALDEIADPGNLGTILRTHDAVHGEGVILLDQSTDPYDPSAVRASMGALFSQRLVKASLEEFSHWKTTCAMPLFGTSDRGPTDYQSVVYPTPMVLLMGSERQGLDEVHLRLCDDVVRIPMAGSSDSLNLAVATGVVLYEIFNQRRKEGGQA